MNNNILFLDIETDREGKKIYEFGVSYHQKSYKSSSSKNMANFLILCSDIRYLCGHNILEHDLPRIKEHSKLYVELKQFPVIDTLPVSLLFFNEHTHHALPKAYKNEDDFNNDPVKDCGLTQLLLNRIVERYMQMQRPLQKILYSLLYNEVKFEAFFSYLSQFVKLEKLSSDELLAYIAAEYTKAISNKAYLAVMIETSPVELSYILALLTPYIEIKAHPPKVLYDYPQIIEKQRQLCYDYEKLSAILGSISKEIFDFGEFRFFPKLNPSIFGSNTLSQRDIVEAALRRESFLAILPTGGGKTFTFWLPAIIQASKYKSLTVVISPLQALIEDHIKSFESKVANYRAVAISGFMTPQERAESIEQVINGVADILYIAPESLRSNTIFSILKNRYIERFVVDEAHCLSTWGNDFRQDYYYICNFVQDLIDKKPFQEHIPISCFTATAKPGVIEDIKNYFNQGLGLDLGEYLAKPERNNLQYRAIDAPKQKKYTALLKLIEEHKGSTLVYIPTSTKMCDEIAEKLALDTGKSVRSFHSKIESQEKMKILKDYILNNIEIIVATTAFGMGVDKPDITQVLHYEPSDSLENYSQEAGRGARDQNLVAQCPILYDESDLDKHFRTLRRSKITVSEINAIFRIIKNHPSRNIILSTKELAHQAGWDTEDTSNDYNTKIKTILLELEREGYITRKRNQVRYFGDSVASDSREILYQYFEENRGIHKEDEWQYIEVLNRIFGKGKDTPIQIDDIAMVLGIGRDKVALILNEFIDIGIVGDSKDMSVEMIASDTKKLKFLFQMEMKLLEYLFNHMGDMVMIKELNEYLIQIGLSSGNEIEHILEIIKGWRSRGHFSFSRMNRQQDLWQYQFSDKEKFHVLLFKRQRLLEILLKELLKKKQEGDTIGFSLVSLKKEIGKFSLKEIDRGLLFLHRHKLIRLIGGRFIHYAPMQIERLELMEKKNKIYTKQDYKNRLEPYYRLKTEGVHIMGEYANRLLRNPVDASKFLQDYFTLKYDTFKRRYKLIKETLSRPITIRRYKQIFDKLSDAQQSIIEDHSSHSIMIMAGPGSGKTMVLVHKIASLVFTEDVRPEHFMMLTFSRSAVREFRIRLYHLIGESVYDMEINTFHAYALKLIGRTVENGNSEVLKNAIIEATKQIQSGAISIPYLKALVIDEYQDINEDAYKFILTIAKSNPDMRLIIVGDDDQCIMEYTGADVSFFSRFKNDFSRIEIEEGEKLFAEYNLLTNYRSTGRIVKYAEAFIVQVSRRIKSSPLQSHRETGTKVEIIRYDGEHLMYPAVSHSLTLTTDTEDLAILAFTNDEVMAIYSQLHNKGIKARYLIERPRFEVKNIEEVRIFDQILNKIAENSTFFKKQHFEEALEEIERIFKRSKNLLLLKRIVYGFLNESENLSISIWMEWLEELDLDTLERDGAKITVSTIHKSKGLEFDNVIMVAQKPIQNNQDLRLYYVGMTRAKNRLTIFHKGDKYFNVFSDHCINRSLKADIEPSENTIIIVMGLSDIHLGFDGVQNHNNLKIIAGESLQFHKSRYNIFQIYYQNNIVGQISKTFQERLNRLLARGYHIKNIEVDFVVSWHDRNNGKNLRHVLGKITLQS